MANGWSVFALIACIVLCSGFILAIVMMRASWTQREREALTSADLAALEESAVFLIDQLKSEADRGIAELDSRCTALRELIVEADRKLDALKVAAADRPEPQTIIALGKCTEMQEAQVRDSRASPSRDKILELASGGLDCVDIARDTGLDCAEVKLVLNLSKLPAS